MFNDIEYDNETIVWIDTGTEFIYNYVIFWNEGRIVAYADIEEGGIADQFDGYRMF